MSILQVTAVGVLGAVLALTVKKQSPEIALALTVAASILIFFMILPSLVGALNLLQNLGGRLGNVQHVSTVLQIVGIAYVAELGAQVCTDAGETAIAAKIELAGKVMVMVVAAPILLDVMQMISGLLP